MIYRWQYVTLILFCWQTLINAEDFTNSYCTTPDGKAGQCVRAQNCSSIIEMLRTHGHNMTRDETNYIIASKCGDINDTIYVCCALNTSGLAALDKHSCGKFDTPNVSHGRNVPMKTYRWMALLRYSDPQYPFKCGGSLISERYVLTAAHCVNTQIPHEVRLGEHKISTNPDCFRRGCIEPVQDIGIEQLIVHPDYNYETLSNDIALIRLDRIVQMTRTGHITTICLPYMETLMTHVPKHLIIAGWGNTENSTGSDILQYGRLENRNRSICAEVFEPVPITETQLCVGGTSAKTDSCRGDSGSPLMYTSIYSSKRYDYRMVQYGIVSFGVQGCGEVDKPAIYTYVARYMLWITQNIRD